ncbi:phage major capsid family protein [Amycolatopsis thermoflava]|uniref:phage major capsid family protein n=1 Tax=Amycolatopsis thermoflava TaxID=84480 RepID=UPI003F49BDDC
MGKNPYLAAQQKKLVALQESILATQTRAANENRDLTDEEVRSITDEAKQLDDLGKQVEQLVEIETRSAAIAATAAKVNGAAEDAGDKTPGGEKLGEDGDGTPGVAGGSDAGEKTRSRTTTKDRDPGHYRKKGGKFSFFGDLYKSQVNGDDQARQRLHEHSRALDTQGEGVGVVPPHWMTEEFETLARQGRALANAVRNIPLGDDPRPITLPKQTAGTDNVVAEQAAENDPVNGTDAWDSDVDTATPKPTAGKQVVSRQMLDMSNPAIDQLIYGDLMSVYNMKVEAKVGAVCVAAAGAALASATFATEAAFTGTAPATPALDAVIDLAIAVRNARKLPASILATTVTRYGKFLKLKDTTGRPLIPSETAGPMNVAGVGTVQVDGRIEGLGVIATDGIGDGTTYPEKFLVLRPADVILFEGNITRFRFEEQVGPESVVLGIWAYTAAIARQKGAGTQSKSIRAGQVTAA